MQQTLKQTKRFIKALESFDWVVCDAYIPCKCDNIIPNDAKFCVHCGRKKVSDRKKQTEWLASIIESFKDKKGRAEKFVERMIKEGWDIELDEDEEWPQCPKCEAIMSERFEFCPSCGAKLPEPKMASDMVRVETFKQVEQAFVFAFSNQSFKKWHEETHGYEPF